MANINTVWREFGKHSEAGKLLFELYGVKNKPTVDIPIPKAKSKTNTALPMQSRGKSVPRPLQATQKINYPEPKKKPQPTFSKIDFVVKRKPEHQIREEMEIEKKRFNLPINPPKNRKADIEKLQDNFQFQERKVMPQGARMPGIKAEVNKEDIYAKKSDYYFEEEPSKKEKYKPKEFKKDKRGEMEYLYSQIMKEIDERYKHIDEMKALGKGKEIESVLLTEIKDRINELKYLEKMMENS